MNQRTYFVGLDLGQLQDFSALSVIEETGTPDKKNYAVRYLHRWQSHTPYPKIVEDTAKLVTKLPQHLNVVLCIDATGVGGPVVDWFKAWKSPNGESLSKLIRIMPITITGGFTVSRAGIGWHVPKKDLVGVMQVLLANHRFKVASSLEHAKTLAKELTAFRVKVNAITGNESFEAWREKDHDDLVLAVALPCWYAMRKHAAPSFGMRIHGAASPDNRIRTRVVVLTPDQLANCEITDREFLMVLFADPERQVVSNEALPSLRDESRRNGVLDSDVVVGAAAASTPSRSGEGAGDHRGQPPPHSLKLQDAPYTARFADLELADVQAIWNEPHPDYGRLPSELVMSRDDGKRLWAYLLRKRASPVVGVCFVAPDETDRRALSVAYAYCDVLGLPRACIWDGEEGSKHDGKAPNVTIYDQMRATRGMVVG